MIEALRAGRGGRGLFDLFDQLFERGFVAQINDFEGIGHAEVYGVFCFELLLPADALAVDERAVAAAKIFEVMIAIDGRDLRLQAADATVAEDKFVAGLAADAEWERRDGYLAADAGRVEDENA